MKPFSHLFYRIPFSETDAMGIVHHGNPPLYLERGRIELLRLIGHDYLKITEQGLHFPVVEMSLRYKRPLKFDDIIVVETFITLLTKTRLNFDYRIYRTSELALPVMAAEKFTGEELVLGQSQHCCTNDQGRPVAIAKELFDKLSEIFKEQK